MTTSEQLRLVHLSVLKTIANLEVILANPDFEQGSHARDYAFKMQHEIESTLYNQLFNIKDVLGVNWNPIEESEVVADVVNDDFDSIDEKIQFQYMNGGFPDE